MQGFKSRRIASTLVLCLATLLGAVASDRVLADSPLAGRTITYFIGSDAGGGYDRFARLIGRYMERQIPGSTVVPVNRGTASGVAALRELAVADADSAVMMSFNTGLLLGQVGGMDGIDFDLLDFRWIGKAASEARVLLVHTDSDVTGLDELRASSEELVFVTSGFGGAAHVQLTLLKHVFDLPVRVVPGFGGNEAEAALLKGEVDGLLVSESNVAPLVEAGAARAIAVFGTVSDPLLADVPPASAAATTEDQRLVVRTIDIMTALGRPTVAAPAVSDAILAEMRAAYAAAIADPAFLAEAAEQGLPIDYLDGAASEAMAAELLASIERLRDLVTTALAN
jgi:tripartite-type tricarboxylate transporter receptor subunit TctC